MWRAKHLVFWWPKRWNNVGTNLEHTKWGKKIPSEDQTRQRDKKHIQTQSLTRLCHVCIIAGFPLCIWEKEKRKNKAEERTRRRRMDLRLLYSYRYLVEEDRRARSLHKFSLYSSVVRQRPYQRDGCEHKVHRVSWRPVCSTLCRSSRRRGEEKDSARLQ